MQGPSSVGPAAFIVNASSGLQPVHPDNRIVKYTRLLVGFSMRATLLHGGAGISEVLRWNEQPAWRAIGLPPPMIGPDVVLASNDDRDFIPRVIYRSII